MSDTQEIKTKVSTSNIPKLEENNYESWYGRMEAYLKFKKLWVFAVGSEVPSDSKRLELCHILINHLGDSAYEYDACASKEVRDKPALLWTSITDHYASPSVNNRARVCRKYIQQFPTLQIGVPDDLISISILAKLSKDMYNVVDNIVMNESIVHFPKLTIKKLQEVVYLNEIRDEPAPSTSNKSKVKEESSAFKTESRIPNPNPCSKGVHNPKSTHPAWKCWRLTDEQRIAARPASRHATSAVEPESDYVEVSAYLNIGTDRPKPAVLDSGASHHMINNDKFFRKMKEVNIEINTSNHKQRVMAVAMGEVQIINDSGDSITLHDVLFTPDLNRSLISMNRLFSSSISIIKKNNNFEFSFDNKFKLSGKISNHLFELSNNFAMKSASSYLASSKDIDWHSRLGHPNNVYLQKLIPNSKVRDCETCKMCKAVKKPFKGKFTITSDILEAVHLDLVGPFQTQSVSGCKYFLTIVDQHLGFKAVKLLKHKSETLDKLEEWIAWAENQTGRKIKRLISDNGGEFKSIFFEEFCCIKGISQFFSPPYTPQNNGMAERSNRAILDKAKCLFAQANLLPRYWAEAIHTATDLCNLLPSSTREFKIPYNEFFGRKANLNKLRSFGCLAYVLIPEVHRKSKLHAPSKKGIFLGYANDFSTYCVRKIESKTRKSFNHTDLDLQTQHKFQSSLLISNHQEATTTIVFFNKTKNSTDLIQTKRTNRVYSRESPYHLKITVKLYEAYTKELERVHYIQCNFRIHHSNQLSVSQHLYPNKDIKAIIDSKALSSLLCP
ncbi:hypothetical protein MJO29_007752 [Puccinia striiformis f. sp. tritici]|nr:hypothetical protein MJO29_007752 [Puccinia striiformis f. sp. tritici]